MERCLGAGGFPSGAATLDLPVASAVATTTAGIGRGGSGGSGGSAGGGSGGV